MLMDIPSLPVVDQMWLAPGNVYYRWTGQAWELVDPLSTPVSRVPTCTTAPTPPGAPFPADFWYNTANGFLFIYYDDGNTQQWVVCNPGRGGVVTPPSSMGSVFIDDYPPLNPAPGTLWWSNELGVLFVYYDDGTSQQWVATGGGGGGSGSSVYVGDTPPAGVLPKTLWWNSAQGALYIYYDDGNTTQWVPASPTSSSVAVRGTANVLDFIPNNLWPAIADGTSTTDVYAYLQNAIDSGADELYFPAGKYQVGGGATTQWLIHPGNQHWRGAGIGRTIIEKVSATSVPTGNFGIARALGSINTTQGNLLAAPGANAGAYAITLVPGKIANFAVGDIALLVDETMIPYGGVADPLMPKQGEFVTITDWLDDEVPLADTLRLVSPLQYTYTSAATAQLQKISWLRGVQVSDMSFTNRNQLHGNKAMWVFGLCMEPKIINCSAYNSIEQGFAFTGCYNTRATVEVHDLLSHPGDGLDYYGYGVLESGPNVGGQFNITASRIRHAYTTGGGLQGSGNIITLGYGVPTSTLVTGVCTDSYMAAWDTHPAGYGIVFNGCIVNGSQYSGIQMRSHFGKVIGCHISKTVGPGIYITNFSSGRAEDSVVDSCVLDRTNCGMQVQEDPTQDWRERAAIEDMGIRSTVTNCYITNCGGAGISMHLNARDAVYRNIRIVNPCRLSTTMKDAVSALGTVATTVRIENVDISCTDTKMYYGVHTASTNLNVMISGVRVTGAQGVEIQTPMSATIVGGAVNIANLALNIVSILPEADANDDLVTINGDGAEVGQPVLIRNGSAKVITIKPSPPAAGNITTPTGADLPLTTSSFRMLTWFGTAWIMTSGT